MTQTIPNRCFWVASGRLESVKSECLYVYVLYDCLINKKDVREATEYIESDIDTLFDEDEDDEDNQNNEDNEDENVDSDTSHFDEEESDIDLLSCSSDTYDESDEMEISTRNFVPVSIEF